MFGHYDTNADNYLQGEELWKASEDDKMSQLSQACILADMLLFDDVDKDGKLSVAEFYGAFNKLDSEFLVDGETGSKCLFSAPFYFLPLKVSTATPRS